MMVNKRVREIVRFVRLELYNRGLTCGAGAVRHRLKEVYELKPLPSVRTIGRILAAEGLTAAGQLDLGLKQVGRPPKERMDPESAEIQHVVKLLGPKLPKILKYLNSTSRWDPWKSSGAATRS